jgi:hypothetical protein
VDRGRSWITGYRAGTRLSPRRLLERYDGWTGAPNRGRSYRSFTDRFAEQSGVRVPRLAAVGIALMD